MGKRKRRTKKRKRTKKIRLIALIGFLALILMFVFLFINRKENSKPSESSITFVRGVDVSRYQGNIDFNKLFDQSIRFAFIKATEGKDHIDSTFSENWKNARTTNMKLGAYHFYIYSVSGLEQAENFISQISLEDGDFGPVIDLEYYGEYIKNPAPTEEVKTELRKMIDRLYEEYGKRVIIYCNKFVYDRYLKNDFSDVDIWYRSIGNEYPVISDGRKWIFWQYDDAAKLEGYGGPGANEFIDLNYFHGDMEDLEEYGRNNN